MHRAQHAIPEKSNILNKRATLKGVIQLQCQSITLSFILKLTLTAFYSDLYKRIKFSAVLKNTFIFNSRSVIAPEKREKVYLQNTHFLKAKLSNKLTLGLGAIDWVTNHHVQISTNNYMLCIFIVVDKRGNDK